MAKMFDKLKQYKNYSNDSLYFKFIYDESDLNNEKSKTKSSSSDEADPDSSSCCSFQPEFTHQIFGDEEIIFGYKNLRIDYYLTPGLLDAYIGLNYAEKITPQRFDGIEADDIYASFIEFGCSPGFTRNLDIFCTEKLAHDRQFQPFGSKIHEYQKCAAYKFKDITNSDEKKNDMKKFEIFKVGASSAEFHSPKFIEYLDRIQTMLVYFIESSNFIDTDDPKWSHYILYEKRATPASCRYLTIGYLSVYQFYAYPDKTRYRVSQMLILPPYQKGGHGAELLEAVYRDAAQSSSVIDVTAESPSPEFLSLRDFVTSKMCATLSSFRDVNKLRKGFANDMVKEALKHFKIPKLQSRRCYEIIRMANTNENSVDEWKAFSLDLKKRFYATFLRYSKFARNSKSVNGEESGGESVPASSSSTSSSSSKKPESEKANTKESFTFKKPSSNKLAALNSRFGLEEMSEKGSFSTTPAASSSSSLPQATNGGIKKKVSFSASNVAFSRLETSESNEEEEEDEDDDGQEEEDGDDGEKPIDFAKLLVSESERNDYINQQFEEAIKEYRKTLLRLEFYNILPF
jgi:histone acetyltransferase 1